MNILRHLHKVIDAYQAARALLKRRPPAPAPPTPPTPTQSSQVDHDQLDRRLRAFIAERARGFPIHSRGGKTMGVAIALLVGFDLDHETAWRWLCEWNLLIPRPWSGDQLRHKLDDAAKIGGERGCLLNAERPARAPTEEELQADLIQGEVLFGVEWVSLSSTGTIIDSSSVQVTDASLTWDEIVASMPPPAPRPAQQEEPPRAEVKREFCPNPIPVYQKNEHDTERRLIMVPCGQTDCSHCWEKKKEHRRETVATRLETWERDHFPETQKNLWQFRCPIEEFKRVRWWLSRNKADYFWIADLAAGKYQGGSILFFSTSIPPGVAINEFSVTVAVALLNHAIDHLPAGLHVRYFGSSRPWKLLDDRQESDEHWSNIGKIESTPQVCLGVLQSYGLDLQPVDIPGRWWSCWGQRWSMEGVDADQLDIDLECGRTKRPTSGETDEWTSSPEGGYSETTGDTPPPAEPFEVIL